MVVVIGEGPERLDDPGPDEFDRARHQGQRRDIGEAAIDFSEWAVDGAPRAMLDAVDARAYAEERANAAGS